MQFLILLSESCLGAHFANSSLKTIYSWVLQFEGSGLQTAVPSLQWTTETVSKISQKEEQHTAGQQPLMDGNKNRFSDKCFIPHKCKTTVHEDFVVRPEYI